MNKYPAGAYVQGGHAKWTGTILLCPLCEFSSLELALAICFTRLFIVNINRQLNFEALNGNDVWNVLISHIHPAPFHKTRKS